MFGEKLIAWLGLDATEFDKGVDHSKEKMGGFTGAMAKLGEVVEAAAVLEFFKHVIEKGAQLAETAERLNITTDSIQSLSYMAQQAGVKTEAMDGALNKLSVSAANASDAHSAEAKALAKLGINVAEFIALPLDRQFEMVAKANAEATDKGEAYAAVCDLLGSRNAPRLNTVLKDLAEKGLDGVTKSAKEAGQVIEGKTLQQMKELGDTVVSVLGYIGAAASKELGWVMDFGTWLGKTAAAAVNLFDGIATSAGDAATATDKASEAAATLLVTMKGTAATAEDIKKLDEARAKLKEKEMTDQEKINSYLEQFFAKGNEALKVKKDSHEYDVLKTEQAELQLKMLDLQLAGEKKATDEQKKRGEEINKLTEKQQDYDNSKLTAQARLALLQKDEKDLKAAILEDDAKGQKYIDDSNKLLVVRGKLKSVQSEIDKDAVELAKLLLVPEGERTEVQKEQIKLLLNQTTKVKEQGEILLLNAKLISGAITPAERERLAVLVGITNEITKQKTGLDAIVADYGKISYTGQGVRNLSTAQLAEDERNLSGQVFQARAIDQMNPFGHDFDAQGNGVYGMAAALTLQLRQVQEELSARSTFAHDMAAFGAATTQKLFSAYDFKRLSDITTTPDNSTQIATTLSEINIRLAPVFPKG